ncbi:hypothetical protein SCLCIDRAFT_448194 [Scleroderma citrinum Foug A]|uniref:Uncharacterized protein n=1 Tax=Scleroderma citrinum Foug A TaxID=1036808 RepID=A0A0C2YUK4_9AGAM|nr:hypothetical protein SCLCIDRAFT_448194 [Scleroderma citrinum Foug A]
MLPATILRVGTDNRYKSSDQGTGLSNLGFVKSLGLDESLLRELLRECRTKQKRTRPCPCHCESSVITRSALPSPSPVRGYHVSIHLSLTRCAQSCTPRGVRVHGCQDLKALH